MHTEFIRHPGMRLLLASFVSGGMVAWSPLSVPTASLQPVEPAKPYIARVIDRPAAPQHQPEAMSSSTSTQSSHSTSVLRVSGRLQRRIWKWFQFTIRLEDVATAVETQRSLLQRTTDVTFTRQNGQTLAHIHGSLQEHPTWMRAQISPFSLNFILDESAIIATVNERLSFLPQPTEARITGIVEDRGVRRVTIEGDAKPGYAIDPQLIAASVRDALLARQTTLGIPLQLLGARIVNEADTPVGNLELIAQGKSNFAGSGNGRKSNVRKGLSEKINGVLLLPGEEFSFNKALGNFPRDGGWEKALGIFNGSELRPVIGGGLCQVSTTTFRAAVQAGLPIPKRKSHSLFVSYYEKHGVGIDATIFVGSQDLTFVNDTGNALLLQAYADGDEAFVDLYGTPDGRSVELRGPYFSSTAPKEFSVDGRKIKKNEIAWERIVKNSDGVELHSTILSRYKDIPRAVVARNTQPVATSAQTVHGAAN